MSLAKRELAVYRRGVGIMLLSREGLAFVGRRIHMPPGLARWQMPQGGIDAGETPRQAAQRELKEEVGTGRAEILAESRGWFHHDVPDEIAQGMMGGRYRGNRQKWFAMQFRARMRTSTSPRSIRNLTPGNGSARNGCPT